MVRITAGLVGFWNLSTAVSYWRQFRELHGLNDEVAELFALLALPPILINTCTALQQVDPDMVDAARGMGMTRAQIMRKVELPVAIPVIFAGIRTAAVQVVSGAVLAAYIGGGGLGDFITAGIAMMALPQLFVGAIPATLLALELFKAMAGLKERAKTLVELKTGAAFLFERAMVMRYDV